MTKPSATLKECIVLVRRGEEREGWRRKREGRGGKEEKTVEKNRRGGQFAEFAEITLD